MSLDSANYPVTIGVAKRKRKLFTSKCEKFRTDILNRILEVYIYDVFT